jgi:hypothetical protein
MAITERDFKCAVAAAWEGLASDCGSQDGEGAVDHLESIFFALAEDPDLDPETRSRVERFEPELKRWALAELKKYG